MYYVSIFDDDGLVTAEVLHARQILLHPTDDAVARVEYAQSLMLIKRPIMLILVYSDDVKTKSESPVYFLFSGNNMMEISRETVYNIFVELQLQSLL